MLPVYFTSIFYQYILPVYFTGIFYQCMLPVISTYSSICSPSLEQPNPCSDFPRKDSSGMKSGTVDKRAVALYRNTVLVSSQLVCTSLVLQKYTEVRQKTLTKIQNTSWKTLGKTAIRT